MSSITNFDQLIQASITQPVPQRLLFLFAKATPMTLPYKSGHQSGTITPVMCVDKLPSELTDFKSLVAEADKINTKWDFILMAGLSGKDGQAPSSKDADSHLLKMSNDLTNGENISRFAIFDREEKIVVVS